MLRVYSWENRFCGVSILLSVFLHEDPISLECVARERGAEIKKADYPEGNPLFYSSNLLT